jgi:carbonic anhydrase/acetyltransferase-like protein (isoleucine patch superfamily)
VLEYNTAKVSRQFDAASPSTIKFGDSIRTRFLFSRRGVTYGKNVCAKPKVQLSIPDTGSLSIGDNCLFHSGVKLILTMPKPIVEIGQWVFVGLDTIIAAKQSIEIGDFTFFAPRCYVIDHEHGFEPGQLIHNQKSILKSVKIGRDCYVGTGSVVLGGASIGDGAIIGACSVVKGEVGSGEIWAGNPARKIGMR